MNRKTNMINFEPKSEDAVDMFLTDHSEDRIRERFPKIKFKDNIAVFASYCESPRKKPIWVIPINGGYIIGKWVPSRPGSFIRGIFIAQTALYSWQFKRSEFQKMKSVQVRFRKIVSQKENKALKETQIHDMEESLRRSRLKVDRDAAITMASLYGQREQAIGAGR